MKKYGLPINFINWYQPKNDTHYTTTRRLHRLQRLCWGGRLPLAHIKKRRQVHAYRCQRKARFLYHGSAQQWTGRQPYSGGQLPCKDYSDTGVGSLILQYPATSSTALRKAKKNYDSVISCNALIKLCQHLNPDIYICSYTKKAAWKKSSRLSWSCL